MHLYLLRDFISSVNHLQIMAESLQTSEYSYCPRSIFGKNKFKRRTLPYKTSGSQIFFLFLFPFHSSLIYLYFESHFGQKRKGEKTWKSFIRKTKKNLFFFLSTLFCKSWSLEFRILVFMCSKKNTELNSSKIKLSKCWPSY